jgi:hypothetical protein
LDLKTTFPDLVEMMVRSDFDHLSNSVMKQAVCVRKSAVLARDI